MQPLQLRFAPSRGLRASVLQARSHRRSHPPAESSAASATDGQPAQHAVAAFVSRGLFAGLAALMLVATPPPAEAVLALPRGQLPRTAEIALRRSVPAFNADVKAIQDQLEDIALKLRIPQRKPWGSMAQSLAAAVEIASNDRAMMAGVLPANQAQAQQLVEDIQKGLGRLADAVGKKDADRTSIRVGQVLRQVSSLELLQAPGLPYNLPRQYASLPRLTGRAVVELTVRQGAQDEGGPRTTQLQIILDGYSAPITAGNFAANVQDGIYNGAPLGFSYNSILVGEQEAAGTEPERAVPLEMLALGDFEPQYRAPLDVRGGELPVLPLSINGAVAMAQLADPDPLGGTNGNGGGRPNGLVSSRQWFIHKFDRSQAGLAGLSFDEGEFGVFGYVTQGADTLYRLGGGDVIVSAKLVEGADKLVRPTS